MFTDLNPTLNTLFDQLGLPSSDADIDTFVKAHQLKPDVSIRHAEFWTPSQRQFINEGLMNDAVWAEVIDDLNDLLHGT